MVWAHFQPRYFVQCFSSHQIYENCAKFIFFNFFVFFSLKDYYWIKIFKYNLCVHTFLHVERGFIRSLRLCMSTIHTKVSFPPISVAKRTWKNVAVNFVSTILTTLQMVNYGQTAFSLLSMQIQENRSTKLIGQRTYGKMANTRDRQSHVRPRKWQQQQQFDIVAGVRYLDFVTYRLCVMRVV